MNAVEDLIRGLKEEAVYRWFGAREPELQSAIRHGYLLALEEVEQRCAEDGLGSQDDST